jgi:multidrug efflux system membrane fusion protein
MRSTLALLLVAAACGDSSSQAAPGARGGRGGGPVMFPVEVAKVEARRVEYTVNAVGTVEAFEKVQVTARVGGAVEKVRFSEGDEVKDGQVLVEIEPRRYQVAVQQARAAVARAQAQVADARAGLERREKAVAANPGLITGEEIETFRTRVTSGQADVAAARAALDMAQLNLRDAYVRAPAAGIIETRTVATGQYLQPGAVLATLVRRDPLMLKFQVPELEARQLAVGSKVSFRVRAEETEHAATITHVAGAANEGSRLVAITAEIAPGSARVLRPGVFAEVTAPLGASSDAPVIPQLAVRPSEKGFLAFVVEGDTAHERVLTLGLRTADGRVEVRGGLKPGELLVVRGAEALRDGVKVRVAGPEVAPVGARADAGRTP